MTFTDAQIDAALRAWFAAPTAHSLDTWKAKMRAALEAAAWAEVRAAGQGVRE